MDCWPLTMHVTQATPITCGGWLACDGHRYLHNRLTRSLWPVGCCGEQACPALGCEAAPNPDTEFFQENCSAFTGAASRPNAGQACSPQEKLAAFRNCVDTYGHRRQASARSARVLAWLTKCLVAPAMWRSSPVSAWRVHSAARRSFGRARPKLRS